MLKKALTLNTHIFQDNSGRRVFSVKLRSLERPFPIFQSIVISFKKKICSVFKIDTFMGQLHVLSHLPKNDFSYVEI